MYGYMEQTGRTDESSLSEEVGRLSCTDLTKKERENFLKYLARARGSDAFDFISLLMPGNDFLRFLDIMSSETIKVPRRVDTLKLLGYIQIYTYIKNRLPDMKEDLPADELPDATLTAAAHMFNRRKNSVKRIYEKVRGVLARERDDV